MRGEFWKPLMMSYTAGTAMELVPERCSYEENGSSGYRSLVCWRAGRWNLRTLILIRDVPDEDSVVEECNLDFLTPIGWKPLIVWHKELISMTPKSDDKDMEDWIREVEKGLIRDAMRVLEGFGEVL